jgi:hypothetical protein
MIEPRGKAYFFRRLGKLFNMNNIRLNELLETLQYGLLYGFVTFLSGTSIDKIFPEIDKEKSNGSLFLEILLQSMFLTIVVFYIRKFVKIVPFLFYIPSQSGQPRYKPYLSSEFDGEIIIAIILISSQVNLIAKIVELSERFF